MIDFIDALRIGDHDRWPVFNVADAAIVVGVVSWSCRTLAEPVGPAGTGG